MTMPAKYSDLRTLDGLDAAIRENKARLKKQAKSIEKSFAAVQRFYTPRNLLEEGARRSLTSLPFYGSLLSGISFLRKRLKKK